jgi:tellurite resistance protein
MGAGFLMLGAIATGFTYAIASNGGTYIVTTGAFLIGGFQLVIGLLQAGYNALKSPERKREESFKRGSQLIIRSMAYVAAADYKLEDDEVLLVRLISKSLLGFPIDENQFRKIYENIRNTKNLFLEDQTWGDKKVTREDSEIALSAAVMVALSDGSIAPEEMNRIKEIAEKLNLTEALSVLIDEARIDYAKVLDALSQPSMS